MSESHSTAPPAAAKAARPSKPYPDFPLTAHPAGYWCKKIRGKLHYFGPRFDLADHAAAAAAAAAAEREYNEQAGDLHAGRKPREQGAEGVTVKELCNRFLNAKRALVDSAELSPMTWDDYKEAAELVVSAFGKGRLVSDLEPADFASLRARMAKRWG